MLHAKHGKTRIRKAFSKDDMAFIGLNDEQRKVVWFAPSPQEKGGTSVSQESKRVTITVPHALYEAVEDMAGREGQPWHSMLLRLVRRGIIETKVLHERLGKEGQPIHRDICSIAERDKEKR